MFAHAPSAQLLAIRTKRQNDVLAPAVTITAVVVAVFTFTQARPLTSNRSAGFTIIEMLAAMTVFFMVIGILVSGIAQALRLAEAGQRETTYSRDSAIRLGWFRETVGLSIIPASGQGKSLVGDKRKVSGITLQSLNTESAGPGAFTWTLEFNSRANETELQYQSGTAQNINAQSTNAADRFQQLSIADNANSASTAYTALAWPGNNGRFRFLDAQNNWRDQWPAESLGVNSNDPTPPLAIGLEYGTDGRLFVVHIQNRTLPLPSLKELLL